MRPRDLTGFRELLARYVAVFRESWRIRHENDLKRRLPDELAFLPAHLEIIDTPAHPGPQWTGRIIALLGVSILALAFFGHLDIVAIAPGKLVPDARVKVIQPALTGVLRSILVHDSQRVEAGQLLMELDPTQAEADTGKANAAQADARLTVARSEALLRAQSENRRPVVAVVADAPPERQTQAQDSADGFYNEYRAKLASLRAELSKRDAELATTAAEIRKLTQTAPLSRQQADAYKALAKENYVARGDYLDKEQTAIAQTEELAAQRSHAQELQAAIEEQLNDIKTTEATFRREHLEEMGKAQELLSQATNDTTKAEVRQALMRLTAPVAGTVQQLTVHTVGGVVTTAQPVLEIVPDDALEVEAHLENKDIGFVAVGQPAVVKIEAFPYTRFGYMTGTVDDVSNDAVSDKKGALYFVVRIKLPSRRFWVENKWVNLTPGMEVQAEIHTGRQTVADYFLSPLINTARSSLRER